jgi:hypothetical protein
MVDSRRLRQACITTPLLVAAITASAGASARELQVRDQAHLLTADDVTRLRSDVASAPFDARLIVTTEHAESQDLARYVEQYVSEPDMVLVGLDPEHHHVQVRFGTGSRVPQSSWVAIEKSGNDAFRRGDWEAGTSAIFRAATDAIPAGTLNPAEPAERVGPAPGAGILFRVIGGFIVLALLASFFFRRRNVGPYGGYGPGSGPGYGPPYGGGGYGYGPPGGGMGPVGGGLIGAGLGGLAGYELGKLEGEREDRDREGLGSGGQSGDSGGGNYDGGGGGSDWDAGGGGGGFDGGDGGGGGGGSDF